MNTDSWIDFVEVAKTSTEIANSVLAFGKTFEGKKEWKMETSTI